LCGDAIGSEREDTPTHTRKEELFGFQISGGCALERIVASNRSPVDHEGCHGSTKWSTREFVEISGIQIYATIKRQLEEARVSQKSYQRGVVPGSTGTAESTGTLFFCV
jgi:hypothetical protein